ncbi:hypothetical protein HHK36_030320 [Tetracentron sinense]|uniref:Uncharacterized protein n=1 Tax=Tetracentron sinense TaxID=13715 RepID=A0A834Y9P4_TETSI|nr:hypothetical protein HHK36_030320 [Tetracentron sinense]
MPSSVTITITIAMSTKHISGEKYRKKHYSVEQPSSSDNRKRRFERIFSEEDEILRITKTSPSPVSATATRLFHLIGKSLSAAFSHVQLTENWDSNIGSESTTNPMSSMFSRFLTKSGARRIQGVLLLKRKMLKEEMSCNVDGLQSLDESILRRMNEEWRSQQIIEAAVFAKRVELIQEQTKLFLDAFASSSRN